VGFLLIQQTQICASHGNRNQETGLILAGFVFQDIMFTGEMKNKLDVKTTKPIIVPASCLLPPASDPPIRESSPGIY
jgi:hypothetical protein